MAAADAETPGARAAGRGRLARRLALLAASALAALALAEGGLRALLALRGQPYDAARARTVIAETASRSADAVPLPGARGEQTEPGDVWGVVHPYVGWETNFAPDMLGRDLRVMVAHPPEEAAQEPYRVLVLGGSVASIFHQLGARHLEPALRELPELAGRKVEWRCYARGAYKQPQLLQYLTLMLSLGVHPDLVVELDGFNEVAIGSGNHAAGIHPSWPSKYQWLPLVTSISGSPEAVELYAGLRRRQAAVVGACRAAARGPWLSSALVGELQLWRIRRLERDYRSLTARYAEQVSTLARPEMLGPPAAKGAHPALVNVIRNWRECSRLMNQLCEANGIRYLHVLQPTLFDPGAKPITDEEREKATIEDSWLFGVENGYPMLRQAGAQLAAEGVPFVDASRVFERVEETLYYDLCHFAERGNELLAAFVAPRMVELLRR